MASAEEDIATLIAAREAGQLQKLETIPGTPPESVNRAVRGAAENIATIPKRAIGAAVEYTDTGQYNPAPIVEATTTMATGAMPLGAARAGSIGMFGGPGLKGADLNRMRDAEKALAKGMDRDEVWKKYGWGDVFGDFKYEILDRGSKFEGLPKGKIGWRGRGPGTDTTFGQVLKHDKLYAADPSMADIPVVQRWVFPGMPSPLTKGGWAPPEINQVTGKYLPDLIYMNPAFGKKSQEGTFRHEGSHAFAHRQGFQPGSNPREAMPQAYATEKALEEQIKARQGLQEIQQLADAHIRQRLGDNPSPKDVQRVYDHFFQMNPLLHQRARSQAMLSAMPEHQIPEAAGNYTWRDLRATEAYVRSMGEAEANVVPKRAKFTEKTAAETPPWRMMNVPEGELIRQQPRPIIPLPQQPPAQVTPSMGFMFGGRR